MSSASTVLRVVLPAGNGPPRELSFAQNISVAQLVAQVKQETGLSSDVLVVADHGYLALGSPLREYNFSQRSTITLVRKEQVCLVVWSQGARRSLLLDFALPVGQLVLYLAVKLGVATFDYLQLHVHGSGEVLRADRSLVEQGVTPNNRLFCLTVAKDEAPFFPPDAVELGFASAAVQPQNDASALLDMPEEALTRATRRGKLDKLNTKRNKFNARYFVLQDADLYYYTEAKAKRAKNILHDPIAAPVADESAAAAPKGGTLRAKKSGEPFVFVVSAGNKTIRLACKSADEGAAWIAAINAANSGSSAAAAAASGKKGGRIFRNRLAAALKRTDGSEVPEVVTRCIEYLDKQSILRVVGLFRLSGSADVILKLVDDIDAGKTVDFSVIGDPHTVTGLLKYYFREMSEPLLTWALFAPLTAACAVTATCTSDRIRYVKQVLQHLPPANLATLAVLMKFLAKVASYSAYNKMPLHNVATVFAPNILRDKDATMLQQVEASPLVNNSVITILEHQDYLLDGGPFPVQSEFPVRAVAKAHHAYVPPAGAGNLALEEGDAVSVLAEGADGWWYGECQGKYGRFPGSYVAKLEEKEAEKVRKKAKIDVKIQEMREQSEHQDKFIARLAQSREQLQSEIDALARERDALLQSSFKKQLAGVLGTMPQFEQTAKQYRDALQKTMGQSELSASLQQELLIALNGLWSAANNPKLAKKHKKALTKLEPLLASARERLQESVVKKREAVETRSDLIKDLAELDAKIQASFK